MSDRQGNEKTVLFAQHLENVFKLHNIISNIDTSSIYQPDQDYNKDFNIPTRQRIGGISPE